MPLQKTAQEEAVRNYKMAGEKKFLAVLAVAMVTIVHSFSFTIPTTDRVSKRYQTSSAYRSSLSSSALGMATWSNGETKKMFISVCVLDACSCSYLLLLPLHLL